MLSCIAEDLVNFIVFGNILIFEPSLLETRKHLYLGMEGKQTNELQMNEASTSLATGTDWQKMGDAYIKLLEDGSEVSQINGTILLGKWSKEAPECVLETLVPAVVQLLGSSQKPVQEAAAYCLLQLCRCNDNLCRLIGKLGAIQHLLGSLVASGGRDDNIFLRCLREIVICCDDNRTIMVRHSGLLLVISSMDSSRGGTKRCFAEILSALSLMKEVRRALVSMGCLPFLVESVKIGVMPSRARAASAIGVIGRTPRARQILVEAGAIEALVELLGDGDSCSKLVAANTLGIISAHVNYIRPVVQAGAIPLIVGLLDDTGSMGKDIVEDVLCVLAAAEENAIDIARHMVTILQGSNDSAKEAAADVLWDLCNYEHSIPVVRASGAIPSLLENLQVGTTEVREKVSGVVAQLSYEEGDRHALADAGVIPILMNLLRDDSEDLKENAAEALIRFSEDPLLRDRISEAFDNPVFQDTVSRLARIHRNEHMERFMTRASFELEQLGWE